MLTPSQKGAAAEAHIAADAISLGIFVLRPMCDGGRYDLAFDVAGRLLRIQCKVARRMGESSPRELQDEPLDIFRVRLDVLHRG